MSDDPARRSGRGPRPLPAAVYARALEVGRTAAGRSGPNPPVGCVIVRDGHIVAEGATCRVGGAHAEVVALEAAGPDARGATAIVTLEPCAHQGRTPPCTDALIAAGVAEVHVLHRDPDPVARGGVERLRAAGIDVLDVAAAMPSLAAHAAHDLRGFVARVRSGRPHVHLKLAQDVEGRTVATHGPYLTGAAARRRVHALRAEADAVLVGGTTVRHDDPRLDVRHMVTTRQPRPVVLSATADLPEESVVLRPGAVVVTGPDIAEDRADAIRARGVDLVTVPTTPDGMLELEAALSALLDLRILTVLAEPGPRLAGALIRQGLVDTLEVHVAGGAAVSVDAVRPAFPELATLLAGPAGVAQESTLDGDLLVRDVGALTGRTPVEVG